MIDPQGRSLQVIVGCEKCGMLFRTPERYVGAQAACPGCGRLLWITAQTQILAPAAAGPPVDAGTGGAKPPAGCGVMTAGLPIDASSAAAPVTKVMPPPPVLAANSISAIPPPPIIFTPLAVDSPTRTVRHWLTMIVAAFSLLAGGVLLLIAAIVAVVPSPSPEFAEQRWSGVVCSLLTAAAFSLPGGFLARRGLLWRRKKSDPVAPMS